MRVVLKRWRCSQQDSKALKETDAPQVTSCQSQRAQHSAGLLPLRPKASVVATAVDHFLATVKTVGRNMMTTMSLS
jgi:hypothetical protein